MNVKIPIETAENIPICKPPFSAQEFNNIIHFSYVSQGNMELLKLVLLSLMVEQTYKLTAVAFSFSQTYTVQACG